MKFKSRFLSRNKIKKDLKMTNVAKCTRLTKTLLQAATMLLYFLHLFLRLQDLGRLVCTADKELPMVRPLCCFDITVCVRKYHFVLWVLVGWVLCHPVFG